MTMQETLKTEVSNAEAQVKDYRLIIEECIPQDALQLTGETPLDQDLSAVSQGLLILRNRLQQELVFKSELDKRVKELELEKENDKSEELRARISELESELSKTADSVVANEHVIALEQELEEARRVNADATVRKALCL